MINWECVVCSECWTWRRSCLLSYNIHYTCFVSLFPPEFRRTHTENRTRVGDVVADKTNANGIPRLMTTNEPRNVKHKIGACAIWIPLCGLLNFGRKSNLLSIFAVCDKFRLPPLPFLSAFFPARLLCFTFLFRFRWIHVSLVVCQWNGMADVRNYSTKFIQHGYDDNVSHARHKHLPILRFAI